MRYIYAKAPEPTKVLGGAIWVYEDIVKNWREIIQSIEKEVEAEDQPLTWLAASTADGRTDGLRRNQILNLSGSALSGSEACRQAHNQLGALIDECVGAYALNFGTEVTDCEDFGMLKYQGSTGDHYDAHYDGGPATRRWISAIIYLNEDYEGGHLEFVHYGVKIKPKAGSLLIFPSNYAYSHIAHKVTSGTKYAIVTWLHN
jgi:predicted 2-oxoglutarate/Fe(II)-dependent dioxygenase YbiX